MGKYLESAKVDVRRCFEIVGKTVLTTLGSYDEKDGVAVPFLKFSCGASGGVDDPGTPSSCHITEETAKLLAAEIRDLKSRTPHFGDDGWHPIFLPTACVYVVFGNGRTILYGGGNNNPSEFVKAF